MKGAVIIGATSGIGRELAKQLVAHGYRVAVTGRRSELLNEIVKEKPESYIASTFDITELEKIPAWLNELVNELGGLDLLIYSSGTGQRMPVLDFKKDKIILDTNVSGFTAVVNWGFNYFIRQKHGHLAAISSVAGIRGNRYAPSYSATKAYQINYLEGLRQKLAKMEMPVYITDIRPGFVDTAMAKGDDIFWVSSVEKASAQILKAIQNRKPVVYITKRWKYLAWLMKLIPSWIYNKIL